MNTDWIFNGTIDAEQKEYVLLGYFQKMNKNFLLKTETML